MIRRQTTIEVNIWQPDEWSKFEMQQTHLCIAFIGFNQVDDRVLRPNPLACGIGTRPAGGAWAIGTALHVGHMVSDWFVPI